MRILHVTEALAAGVGRHVCDLATGLTARGHQIEVLYSPARADPLLLDELLATPHVRTCAVRMRRAPHLSDFAAGAHILAHLVRRRRFDVVHAHSSKAGMLVRVAGPLSGARLIYTPHAFATLADSEFSARRRRVFQLVERALATVTDTVICLGSAEFAHARDAIGIPEARLALVPNSLSPAGFRFESDLRTELGLPRTTPVVGVAARLEPQKGIDIAVRAMATVRHALPHADARLVVLGEGRERTALEGLAAECGIERAVHWLGWRPAREYLHNFDLLLAPSRYEGSAYTPMEALWCGVPVVCTQIAAEAVVIDGINGFVVPSEDPGALALAAVEILRNKDLRCRLAENARARARALAPDSLLEALEQIYRRGGEARPAATDRDSEFQSSTLGSEPGQAGGTPGRSPVQSASAARGK